MMSTILKTSMFLCFILISCNLQKENELIHLYDKLDVYVDQNFTEYQHVYDQLVDTINHRVENSIRSYCYRWIAGEWHLDSLLMVNKAGNLCQGVVYFEYDKSMGSLAPISIMRGYKVNNQWYFRLYASDNYPRVEYQSKHYSPLTLDVKKFLARCRSMRGAYGLSKNDSIEPNEKFFNMNLTVQGKLSRNPKSRWTQKEWDEVMIEMCTRNRKCDQDMINLNIKETEEFVPDESKEPITRADRQTASMYKKVFKELGLEYNE